LNWAGVRLDPSRPHLDSLDSRGRLDWADFQGDFILSQSAEVTEVPAREVIERLKAQHKKTQIPFRTMFGNKQGGNSIDVSAFSLPTEVVSGDQLKGLLSCSVEKCSFKLHTASETLPLTQSAKRTDFLREIVAQRLKAYLIEKQLKGYESRADNIPYVKKYLQLSGFLKTRYPKTYQYFQKAFWENRKGATGPIQSYVRSEVINMAGEKSQPIYRLTENIEFNENGYLNIEIPIYTNHFFDSSFRVFEVFDWPADRQKGVYVVTDIIEVDELKKSELIKKLFKNRMEEAVEQFRKSEMKELR